MEKLRPAVEEEIKVEDGSGKISMFLTLKFFFIIFIHFMLDSCN